MMRTKQSKLGRGVSEPHHHLPALHTTGLACRDLQPPHLPLMAQDAAQPPWLAFWQVWPASPAELCSSSDPWLHPCHPPLPGLPAPAARDEDASFMQEVGLEVKLVDSLSQFRNLWK